MQSAQSVKKSPHSFGSRVENRKEIEEKRCFHKRVFTFLGRTSIEIHSCAMCRQIIVIAVSQEATVYRKVTEVSHLTEIYTLWLTQPKRKTHGNLKMCKGLAVVMISLILSCFGHDLVFFLSLV